MVASNYEAENARKLSVHLSINIKGYESFDSKN